MTLIETSLQACLSLDLHDSVAGPPAMAAPHPEGGPLCLAHASPVIQQLTNFATSNHPLPCCKVCISAVGHHGDLRKIAGIFK